MGVLNVTPDSFFDGGRYDAATAAAQRIEGLLEDGADVIDIGAESTRPGASAVCPDEQIRRLEPALRHAVGRGVLVSVDTTSPVVARFALELGVDLINDVSCLADAELARVCADYGAPLILMHARGPAASMSGFSVYPDAAYGDVVEDVRREWSRARQEAVRAGMDGGDVYFDPGLGFAKNAQQSLTLLSRLAEFRNEGVIVVGPSRKSFIGALDGTPPEERLGGTLAACLLAAARGATLLRIHDVREVRQALSVVRAVEAAPAPGAAHAK